MTKQEIVKIIITNTEYWMPKGQIDEGRSCFIIEETEPFWWRINKKWAEEIAEKIINQLTKQRYEDTKQN